VLSSELTCCSALVTDASSAKSAPWLASSVAPLPPCSAVTRFCCAAASVACAVARFASAWLVPMRARISPARTSSPTATSSEVTVPLTGKASEAVLAAATLPVELSVAWTVPIVAVVVRTTVVWVEPVSKTELSPKPATAATARSKTE
jgi:hypothetical protein